MTHSKLDETIEDILGGNPTRIGADGKRYSVKQALLEAFEQSLPGTIEPKRKSDLAEVAGAMQWNAYRNEAIKVIRGAE